MYAVVNLLRFNRPVESFIEELQNSGLPQLSANEGFIDFHFIRHSDQAAYVIILWRDAACAQAGAKAFGPTWFAAHFKPFLEGPEDRHTGDVLVSSRAKQ